MRLLKAADQSLSEGQDFCAAKAKGWSRMSELNLHLSLRPPGVVSFLAQLLVYQTQNKILLILTGRE
jgi:hypothetical protein